MPKPQDLSKAAIELRLSFSVMSEWASLYVRISREVFGYTLHCITGGGSMGMLVSNTTLNLEHLRLRLDQPAPPNQLKMAFPGLGAAGGGHEAKRAQSRGLPSTSSAPSSSTAIDESMNGAPKKVRDLAELKILGEMAGRVLSEIFNQVRVVELLTMLAKNVDLLNVVSRTGEEGRNGSC